MMSQEERAQYLATAEEDDFLDAVEADLEDDAPALRAALSHPLVCHRWFDALKVRLVDIQNQLNARRPVGRISDDEYREYRDWQRRAVRYQQAVLETRAVAKRAVQDASRIDNAAKAEKAAGSKSASNRAIDRLIAAHPDEFQQYIDDERDALGVAS